MWHNLTLLNLLTLWLQWTETRYSHSECQTSHYVNKLASKSQLQAWMSTCQTMFSSVWNRTGISTFRQQEQIKCCVIGECAATLTLKLFFEVTKHFVLYRQLLTHLSVWPKDWSDEAICDDSWQDSKKHLIWDYVGDIVIVILKKVKPCLAFILKLWQ